VATVPAPRWNAASTNSEIGCEVDEGRQQIYIWSNEGGGGAGTPTMELYDIGGGTFTNIRQADDVAGVCYGGLKYVPELDAVIGLRSATKNGPAFEIVAWRNGVRLWKRPFPNSLVQTIAGVSHTIWPTHTLRFVAGKLYCVLISDGKAQLLWTGDEFQSYTMRALSDPGVGPRCFAGRVNDAYQIACYSGTFQRGLFIAAPFYAGVVTYADFKDSSCAEALKKLAILADALFWVDDDGGAHFVARDLYDPGSIVDISDRVLRRPADTPIWDQTSQWVKVSGNGFEATAGNAGYSSDGIEIESDFIPNAAFAQALADALYAVFHPRREYVELQVLDVDGLTYWPLQRLVVDGMQCFVHESDEDLIEDEIVVRSLEEGA
jgi:hypothetical protein